MENSIFRVSRRNFIPLETKKIVFLKKIVRIPQRRGFYSRILCTKKHLVKIRKSRMVKIKHNSQYFPRITSENQKYQKEKQSIIR